jgi:glycosyltransferase involved in cell wall biosynthesis
MITSPTKNRPIVSVIVPTFNRARFLPDALESIFSQRVPNVEVIVVDDGSTDNTRSMTEKYAGRIRYLYQKNRGSGSARNLGVSLATGRLISFLDSDDVWKPEKMRTELALFDDNPAIDAVICDCERWVESNLVCPSWFADRGLSISTDRAYPLPPAPPLWVKGKIFATCCLTIKRESLQQLGMPPFDTSLETHEDWDLAIRMHHSCNIVVIPQVLAQVRRFDDGSRVGRPLPGTEYPAPVKCVMAYRRYQIFEKALRLEGWTDEIKERIVWARSKAALEFAHYLGPNQRGKLARLVLSELKHSAFVNAVSVLATGLLPPKARPILRSVTAGEAGSQITAVTGQRS